MSDRFTADKKLVFTSLLVLTSSVFFYVPAVIFNGNDEFISGQYLALLPYSSLVWILTLSLIAVAILMLSDKFCRNIAPLVSYVALSFFVMGFYLTPIIVDVGLIDDRPEILELNNVYIVLEILITICILVGIYYYYQKIRKIIQDLLSVLLVLIICFTGYVVYNDISQTRGITADREGFFQVVR